MNQKGYPNQNEQTHQQNAQTNYQHLQHPQQYVQQQAANAGQSHFPMAVPFTQGQPYQYQIQYPSVAPQLQAQQPPFYQQIPQANIPNQQIHGVFPPESVSMTKSPPLTLQSKGRPPNLQGYSDEASPSSKKESDGEHSDISASSSLNGVTHKKTLLPKQLFAKLQEYAKKGVKYGNMDIRDEIDDKMMPELCDWIVKLGNRLRRLRLDCPMVTSKGPSLFFNKLKQNQTNIPHLILSQAQLDEECMKSLIEFIHKNPKLQTMKLENIKSFDRGIQLLSKQLPASCVMTTSNFDHSRGGIPAPGVISIKLIKIAFKLEVFEMDVDEDDMKAICETMKKYGIHDLHEIFLFDNNLTSKSACLVFDTLRECSSKISELTVSKNALDVRCMKHLGKFIQANKQLKYLTIRHANLTDKHIGILSTYLIGNTSLIEVYFEGNPGITDASVSDFIEIAKKSHITGIFLKYTLVSNEKYQEINGYLKIFPDKRQILAQIPAQTHLESKAREQEEMLNTIKRLIKDGDKSSLNRAKIMTGGKGRAGKSATIRSLTGQSFNSSLESTIGADAKNDCEVDIKYADNQWGLLDDEQKKEIASQHLARAMRMIKKKEKEEQDKQEMMMKRRMEMMMDVDDHDENEDKKMRLDDANMNSSSLSSSDSKMIIDSSSSSAPTTQISINNDNDKEEEEKYELKGEMIDKHINDDGIENKITMSIWDLGGQKVFYTLHHLFLTEYAVYLVVFDMRDLIQSTTNDEENERRKRDESLGYIQHWLESIHMHAPGASIFMIGTFKDQVKNEEQHKMISDLLFELAREKMKKLGDIKLVLNKSKRISFWPIDNSQGPDSDDIKRLRRTIMETVENQSFIKDPIPLQWTTTYDMMIDTNKNHITIDEFNLIAQGNKLREDEDRLMMLRRFHQLGMLLYFDKGNDNMKNLIVLNPQWLVDAITKVIRHFDLHDYDDDMWELLQSGKYYEIFKRLKDKSIASVELMYLLWRDEDDRPQGKEDFTRRRYLLSLMENMNLITPWMFDSDDNIDNVGASASSSSISMNSNNRSPKHYLIPSNLRLFGEKRTNERMKEINDVIPFIDIDDINNTSSNNTDKYNGLDCIMIDFSDSMLPVGLYDRLICKLVSHSSKHYRDNRKPIIGNGLALMSIGSNDIRIDEDISKRRIVITIDEKSEKRNMILTNIESMVDKLNKEVMNGYLKHTVYVSMRIKDKDDKNQLCLVDIDKVRNELYLSSIYIRALNGENIELLGVNQKWLVKNIHDVINIPQSLKIDTNKCEILENIDGLTNVYKMRMSNTDGMLVFKGFCINAGKTSPGDIKDISAEIEMLSQLKHDNIVKIIGAIGGPDAKDINNKLMGIGIVMEYCNNGSLRSLLNTNNNHQQLLNMDLIIHLLFGAAQGLEYLHNHKPHAIIHGDIKSDNILIDKEYNAKLCDFGISKLQQSTTALSTRNGGGALAYKAPETFGGKADLKSDVYSFGCVILEMLTGERPWNGYLESIVRNKVFVDKKPHNLSKVRKDAREELFDLMRVCLDYDEDIRPTMKEVRMDLEKMMKQAVLIELDNISDECNKVENLFFPGGDKEGTLNRNDYRIVKIDKIRHLFAERRYDAESSNINSMLNSDDANERMMFHGTGQTDPMEILNHPDAFMKDYSSQGFYGKGLYFAELARYSNGSYGKDDNGNRFYYRYNIPDTNQYQMLVCSVICGNPKEYKLQTNKGFSQKDLGIEYHSIHAGPHCPGGAGPGEDDSCMYVIYKDTQVLPKYLITYEYISKE